jgi:segregation and condensation protein B
VSGPGFHARLIEAMLFASPAPLDEATLAARLPEGIELSAILGGIARDYAERGVNLVKVGGKWQFRTAEDLGPHLRLQHEVSRKLSRAALETLAIIAYHQPVTRGDIEEIRGVSLSRGTLDTLLEAGWVKPKGHREAPGRPALWVTTDGFLEHFGLSALTDLPGVGELKAAGLLEPRPPLPRLEPAPEAAETDADEGEDHPAD